MMIQEMSVEASIDQEIASIVDSLSENDDQSVDETLSLVPASLSLITTSISTSTMRIATDIELYDPSYPPPLSHISLSTQKPSDSPSLQPYAVYFYCSCCYKGYHCIVYSNPWYSVHRQSCPHCGKEQIPMLDINLPINARELDPNMEFYYNEMTEEEFLPGFVDIMNNCDEFSLELLCDPILRVVFAESFYPPSFASFLQKSIDLPLLSLIIHALRCSKSPAQASSLHINPKHGNLCRNVKILLFHMIGCKKSTYCLFPYCSTSRPILSYLSTFPSESVMGTASTATVVSANADPNLSNDKKASSILNERNKINFERQEEESPRRKKVKIEAGSLLHSSGGCCENSLLSVCPHDQQERDGKNGSFMRCIDDDIMSFCQEVSSSSSTFSFLPTSSTTFA
jgi:hypothetical protein